jgi:rubredoxin
MKNLAVYQCTVCGYLYDPVQGDPENGFPAGTAFEDLPSDWVCPLCGAKRNYLPSKRSQSPAAG